MWEYLNIDLCSEIILNNQRRGPINPNELIMKYKKDVRETEYIGSF